MSRFTFSLGPAAVLAAVMALAACDTTSPSSGTANPQVTAQFYRLCSPFQARLDVTLMEAGGDTSMTVTSLKLTMIDINDMVAVTKTYSAAELMTALGSNEIGAGLSRVLSYTTAYPGSVDTMDSTALVEGSFTDDNGHNTTRTVHVGFQHDGC